MKIKIKLFSDRLVPLGKAITDETTKRHALNVDSEYDKLGEGDVELIIQEVNYKVSQKIELEPTPFHINPHSKEICEELAPRLRNIINSNHVRMPSVEVKDVLLNGTKEGKLLLPYEKVTKIKLVLFLSHVDIVKFVNMKNDIAVALLDILESYFSDTFLETEESVPEVLEDTFKKSTPTANIIQVQPQKVEVDTEEIKDFVKETISDNTTPLQEQTREQIVRDLLSDIGEEEYVVGTIEEEYDDIEDIPDLKNYNIIVNGKLVDIKQIVDSSEALSACTDIMVAHYKNANLIIQDGVTKNFTKQLLVADLKIPRFNRNADVDYNEHKILLLKNGKSTDITFSGIDAAMNTIEGAYTNDTIMLQSEEDLNIIYFRKRQNKKKK